MSGAVRFPCDPNAPGGPRRSEFLRSNYTAQGAPARGSASGELAIRLASATPSGPVVVAEVDGDPVAAITLSDGQVVADSPRASSGIFALLQLHRLETRLIAAIWGV